MIAENIFLFRNAAAVILKIAYGYHVDGNDDLLVKIIDEGFKLTGSIIAPGKYLIESFPARQLPPNSVRLLNPDLGI